MQQLLLQELPDIIGTQEGLYFQLQDIRADLNKNTGPRQYEWIGTGRDGGSRGEFMAIFYAADRFTPVEYEHFWIAPDPYSIGQKWADADCARMVTWVLFREPATGRRFYVLNTHLDNVVPAARLGGADLIAGQINRPEPPLHPLEAKVPLIVLGDFNEAAGPGNPVWDALVTTGGLVDTWSFSHKKWDEQATWNDFKDPYDGTHDDWILTSPNVETLSVKVNTFHDGELAQHQYPSDHFPVQAVVRVP